MFLEMSEQLINTNHVKSIMKNDADSSILITYLDSDDISISYDNKIKANNAFNHIKDILASKLVSGTN